MYRSNIGNLNLEKQNTKALTNWTEEIAYCASFEPIQPGDATVRATEEEPLNTTTDHCRDMFLGRSHAWFWDHHQR